ncbi:hypothetical protein HDU81_000832 [Chytriomyces hyalinus]|nr:hypothetical protein HDU81_000832 [Chytriomyces hyalinus]
MSDRLTFKYYNAMLDQLAHQTLNGMSDMEMSSQIYHAPSNATATQYPVNIDQILEPVLLNPNTAIPAVQDISFTYNPPVVSTVTLTTAFHPSLMSYNSLGMEPAIMPPAVDSLMQMFAFPPQNSPFSLHQGIPWMQGLSSMPDNVGGIALANAGTGMFEEMDQVIAQPWGYLDTPSTNAFTSPTTSFCALSSPSTSSATAYSSPTANSPPFLFSPNSNPAESRRKGACTFPGCRKVFRHGSALKQHYLTHSLPRTETPDQLSRDAPYNAMDAQFPVDIDRTLEGMQLLQPLNPNSIFMGMQDISFINNPMDPVMTPMADYQPPFMPDYSLGMEPSMMPPAVDATAQTFASLPQNLLGHFSLDLGIPMLQRLPSTTDSVALDPLVDAGAATVEQMQDIIAQALWSLDSIHSPTADELPSPTNSHHAFPPLSLSSATSMFNQNPEPTKKNSKTLNTAAPHRFPCTFPGCTSILKSRSALTHHDLTHTGARPFPCKVPGCTKAYTTNNRLKVHNRRHTGEAPYICSQPGCSYAATQACSLKAHKQTHAPKEEKEEYKRTHAPQFDCILCKRLYKSKASLRQHVRTHH